MNGIPDDWDQVKTYKLLYDPGGTNTSFYGGLSVGIGEVASVGISFAYSSNTTFGGETSRSFGAAVSASVTGGVGFSVGSNSVGFSYDIAKAMAGYSNVDLNTGEITNVVTDQKNFLSVGLRITGDGIAGSLSKNSIGVSLSSEGVFSISGSEASIDFNARNGGINGGYSLQTKGFDILLPFYFGTANFGYRKTKYWILDKCIVYSSVGMIIHKILLQASEDLVI